MNDLREKFGFPHVESKEMVPTVGQNVQKIEANNVKWTIWDLGGQKRLRELWETYFRDIDVLIWIVDSTTCVIIHLAWFLMIYRR